MNNLIFSVAKSPVGTHLLRVLSSPVSASAPSLNCFQLFATLWTIAHQVPLSTEFSSTLVWRIPWTEEHGGLQSMGSQMSWLSNWKSIAVTWTWFLQSIFIQVLFQSLSYQVLYSVGYQEQTVDPIKKSQDEALCFGQGLHMGLMTPGLCLMMRILCSLQRRDM